MKKYSDTKVLNGKIDFIPPYDGFLEDIISRLDVWGNLRLVGHTGVGKSYLVRFLQQEAKDIFGKPANLYEYSLHADSNRWELLASETFKKMNTEIRDGVVMRWLKDNTKNRVKILFIDEANYIQSGLFSLFNQLADFRGSVYIYEYKKTFVRTKDHYFFIAMNPADHPAYPGTNQANIAQMRRFCPIEIDYLEEGAEVKLLQKNNKDYDTCKKWVSFAHNVRTAFKAGELTSSVISTADLQNYVACLANGMREDRILKDALSNFREAERSSVERFFGKD